MMARELSQRTYPEDRRHRAAPHDLAPRQQAGSDRRRTPSSTPTTCSCSRKFLEQLRATPDGDGSLLDHSLILYGSGMSNGNVHAPSPLPMVGRRRRRRARATATSSLPDKTPLPNLLLSVAQKFGVELPRFGVSTGSRASYEAVTPVVLLCASAALAAIWPADLLGAPGDAARLIDAVKRGDAAAVQALLRAARRRQRARGRRHDGAALGGAGRRRRRWRGRCSAPAPRSTPRTATA